MRKLISIVLLTAMALAIFAGCSSPEETTTAEPVTRATTAATQATTRATTAAPTTAATEATTAAYESPFHPLTGLPTDMSEEILKSNWSVARAKQSILSDEKSSSAFSLSYSSALSGLQICNFT